MLESFLNWFIGKPESPIELAKKTLLNQEAVKCGLLLDDVDLDNGYVFIIGSRNITDSNNGYVVQFDSKNSSVLIKFKNDPIFFFDNEQEVVEIRDALKQLHGINNGSFA